MSEKPGGLNGSMQHLLGVTGRSFKAQSFSWTLIEAQRYLVEIGLRITGQVGFLGKYCRSSPLVFSLVPRCQGLCGSQKKTCTLVATVKVLCLAISSPRSQVNERRRDAVGYERAGSARRRPSLCLCWAL